MPGEFLSQVYIKIDGKEATKITNAAEDPLMQDVLEVVVDTSLYLPEMFTILIQDKKLKWIDHATLDLGKSVEISAETATQMGGQEKGLLIKGEITALEPDFSAEGGTKILVRGYNKSHRLHRGKKSRTSLKMGDSDLVSKITGEVGISADVDATKVQDESVIQSNQTIRKFLQEEGIRAKIL